MELDDHKLIDESARKGDGIVNSDKSVHRKGRSDWGFSVRVKGKTAAKQCIL